MAGPIRIAILANGRQARAEADLTARAYTGMGRTLARTGAALGITGLVAGTVGLAKASISTEAQFSQRMNLIAASIDAPAAELRALSDLAIQLGADTVFSANEAADAMLELAKGGFKQAEIAGGGVQAVMALAATEGLELADAATIVGNAMNAYGLSADEASRIADALAAGSAASSASVASLAEGLGNVGATSKQTGLSIEETVTALTLLDANAIKGAEGGTALRSFLTALTPTSVKAREAVKELGLEFTNADGSFRDLGDISDQLRKKLGGLGEAQRAEALQTIFGSYAKQAASVFLDAGAKGFAKYGREVEKSGVAQKLADARMKGTSGTLERLSGAVETAQLRIGQELAPAVATVADGIGDGLVPAVEAGIDGAKELGRAVAPAVSEITEAIDDLIPSGEDAASMFNDQLVPSVKFLADIVESTVGFVNDLPGPVKEVGIQAGIAALILPRLATAATAAGTSMRNASTYAQVLAMELRDPTSRAQLAQNAFTKMGGAAKQAAGIAGLVGLAQSAQSSNDAVSVLGSTVSGALIGFSTGAGPIGALIGGAGGGLLGIVNAANKAEEAGAAMKAEWDGLKDTLDQVTGATTASTKAFIYDKLERDGVLAAMEKEGISRRTAVGAIAGEERARARVNAVLTEQKDLLDITESRLAAAEREVIAQNQRDAAGDYTPSEDRDAIFDQVEALEKEVEARRKVIDSIEAGFSAGQADIAQLQEKAVATGALNKELKGIADRGRVVTMIEDQGGSFPKTTRDVAKFARQLNLTPKEIGILIRATNADTSTKKVERLLGRVRDVDGTSAEAKVTAETKVADRALDDLPAKVGRAAAKASGEAQRKQPKIQVNSAPAERSLNNLPGQVRNAVGAAQGAASTGGQQVGGALGSGMYNGLGSWAQPLASRAASIVRAAVTAAKRAGDINSPSKETEYLGLMLGLGLVKGIGGQLLPARQAGRNIVRELLAGVTGGSEGVEDSLSKVDNLIEKTFEKSLNRQKRNIREGLREREKELRQKLKGRALDKALNKARQNAERDERDAEKINTKARRNTTKSIRDQRKALMENGRAQDAVNQQLADAESALQSAQAAYDSYAASVKQGFLDYGSISALGAGNGFSSPEQMLEQLRARVAQAEQYAEMLRQLRAAGLNDTTLQQLVDAGVEGGFGTAQTLLQGGAGVIAEFNSLTQQLGDEGGRLGNELAQHFHGAGVQAAAGLVAGLQAQQAELNRAAEQMADALAAAVKKKLKIKSPSRLFAEIGHFTTAGLTDALRSDEVYVKKSGARLAGSLESGFGSPSLAGYSAAASSAIASTGAVGGAFEIELSAQQASDLQDGKRIMAKIDVARSNGVRFAAVPA